VARWFLGGVTLDAVRNAPAVLFSRKDELHHKLLAQIFDSPIELSCAHYLPSSERFPFLLVEGVACGMLPDQQSRELLGKGRLEDLLPGRFVPVDLYWHCWTIRSPLLAKLTAAIQAGAEDLLRDKQHALC